LKPRKLSTLIRRTWICKRGGWARCNEGVANKTVKTGGFLNMTNTLDVRVAYGSGWSNELNVGVMFDGYLIAVEVES
jgi:hypothetical protein